MWGWGCGGVLSAPGTPLQKRSRDVRFLLQIKHAAQGALVRCCKASGWWAQGKVWRYLPTEAGRLSFGSWFSTRMFAMLACQCDILSILYFLDRVPAALPYRLQCDFLCTWAQDERPADLHMAQPNVPVSKTGQFPPAKLVPWYLSWT
jgi:hypothetical protein